MHFTLFVILEFYLPHMKLLSMFENGCRNNSSVGKNSDLSKINEEDTK